MPLASGSTDADPDPHVVTRLLRDQVPDLAYLPVRVSPASGSSNWVFRLGDALAVRLPRTDTYVADLLKEIRWLPHLAPHLATPVPDVVAVGGPSPLFARPWAVVSWLPGELPLALDEGQQARFAQTLGAFLRSLHAAEATGVPRGVQHWGYRCGEPVTDEIDQWADEAAADLADLLDPAGVREAWRRLRRVPPAPQPSLLGAHRPVRRERPRAP